MVPPEKRHIGMVFQDYALFPHMTVAQNILFGLFRWPLAWRRARLAEMLQLVGLEELAKHYPHELSGGQQQRVALARALAPSPQLLLLDEPFSSLDVNLRQQLREEVQDILKRAEITTLLVTHDQEEALSLADALAVIEQGRVVQYDTPEAVIRKPRTRFVARFLALGEFLRGEIGNHGIATEMGLLPLLPDMPAVAHSRHVDLLIRPECLRLCGSGTPVEVVHTHFHGTRKLYTLRLPSGTLLRGLFAPEVSLRSGERVHVRLQPAELVAFPGEPAPEEARR
jgi:iron(III) transport system ATP-binding protein